MIFGLGEKKEKVIAVLDLSSASAGGMLVVRRRGGKPQIISSAREPVNFLMDVDFEAFWRCARNSLKKVIKKMLEDYPAGPDAALCVFSSPWFLSQTKIIEVRRGQPFKITKDFFEKLLSEEEKSFKEKYSARAKIWGNEPRFIEHELIKTELNGYYVEKPTGKSAQNARFHVYMSFGSEKVEEDIKKEILANFGDINLVFKTFPLLAFKVLRSVINAEEGFLLVDISGEITDVLLVKNNALVESVSFPRGRNFLLKKIASEFGTFPQEASSLLRAYFNGHSAESAAKKIGVMLDGACAEWGDFFYKALESVSEAGFLPRSLFLMGGGPLGDLFIKCAEGENFLKLTAIGKPIKIERILPAGLAHHFDLSRFKNETDVFLLIESLYANKIL